MLDKTFDPREVEGRIYAQWEASGAFRAGRRPNAEPFCMVIPPPNVTGRLHIGHALNNTLQDALVRFERMKPIVREWMDEHFPAILEGAVRNEVERAVRAAAATKPRR